MELTVSDALRKFSKGEIMKSVLFVCLGNICRSPAAEGILRHMLKNKHNIDNIHIESCGLGDWHTGKLPDERMRETAKKRGIFLSSRAQKIEPSFFDRFDLILVADNKVMQELHRYALTPETKAKLHFMTHYSPCYRDQEIPDPYYQGEAGFEHVMDMLEDSCEGLINNIILDTKSE